MQAYQHYNTAFEGVGARRARSTPGPSRGQKKRISDLQPDVLQPGDGVELKENAGDKTRGQDDNKRDMAGQPMATLTKLTLNSCAKVRALEGRCSTPRSLTRHTRS